MDNPKVGQDLSRYCWKPGSVVDFFTAVKNCTGKEFDAAAVNNRLISHSVDKLYREVLARLEKMGRDIPIYRRSELNAGIRMVHGDKVLAVNSKSFETMSDVYEKELRILNCFNHGTRS